MKFEIELAVVFVIPSSLVSYVFSNRHALNFFGEKRVQIIELLTILTFLNVKKLNKKLGMHRDLISPYTD